jgi:hypothetical protein
MKVGAYMTPDFPPDNESLMSWILTVIAVWRCPNPFLLPDLADSIDLRTIDSEFNHALSAARCDS